MRIARCNQDGVGGPKPEFLHEARDLFERLVPLRGSGGAISGISLCPDVRISI